MTFNDWAARTDLERLCSRLRELRAQREATRVRARATPEERKEARAIRRELLIEIERLERQIVAWAIAQTQRRET